MGILKTLTINGVMYDVAAIVPKNSVTLLASAWEGEGDVYSQRVEIQGVASNTKLDLQPNAEQLAELHYLTLGFVAENDGGVVTVFAIGDRPTKDYTFQATLTEVDGVGKIRGNTVGTTMPRANLEQTDPTMADYVFGKESFMRGDLVTAIDFTNFDNGSFTETVNGEIVSHTVTFDADGRPVTIDGVAITWGDA